MDIFGIEVTQSNIAIFLGLLTALVLGLVTLYWRARMLWFDFEQKMNERIKQANAQQSVQLQAALDAQTQRIESCIHRLPGHPEGSSDGGGQP